MNKKNNIIILPTSLWPVHITKSMALFKEFEYNMLKMRVLKIWG